jgi:ubiquinone/menaquinone biosynthesis C-methylase UbiE
MIIRRKKSLLTKNHWLEFRSGEIIRRKELEIVLEFWKDHIKGPILEIGAGDGYQHKLLKTHFIDVVPSDINENRWDQSLGKLNIFMADNIPFEDGYFGSIYSSNVLEHIETIDDSLAELGRVLANGGKMIHIIPSPSWKFFQIFAYHIAKFRDFLGNGKVFNPFPKNLIHGVSNSSLEEFSYFAKRNWIKKFQENGFQVKATSSLLFYTPYRFGFPLLPFRRTLAKLGFSSCTAYLIEKKEDIT